MTSRAKHKVLGKVGYNIVKILGKGAYSKVCLIVNETGKKYACKIIKKKLAGLDFIEKFVYREVEINNMIKHSNIVKVHTILESKDAIYMIMDYCRHGDLLEYIKNFGCFPEENAKNYFKQIVEAVCYLHDHDIAHRDLKCENIFLMWNNQVKLGDFGFSRSCSDGFGQKALSDTFCGSLAYAPPEILKGISYDPKMYDVWSLGCVLYIMITASMPFNDANVRKMIKFQMKKSFGSFASLVA
ncbi:testis-specific serine/threonine-protein kinase 1-like isoform X3 [Euwallacea fornicatus]|uniref:testis-specific serine/threonine-protein kinase 1-like isoform X3 n=1 Tax=Euwallacea fornicatus TaxID=995702 RepID=UPI00338E9DDF